MGRYNSILSQCGTHESWFSYSKALDTVLGYSQVAVGNAYNYELTSKAMEGWEDITASWANLELMRAFSVMPGYETQYLDIVRSLVGLHNNTS